MQRIALTADNLDEAIASAVAVLRGGGLVVYPTETVYGLAADASNAEAVSRLLAFKSRPAGMAVSLLVADQEMAEGCVELNATARNLYAAFLPGPMTIVSKSRGAVDARLESELGTLGIRISSHPVAQALASTFGAPLTATAANAAGAARPYAVDAALAALSDRQRGLVGLILDAGDLPRREPSTVIDTTQEVQEVLRVGELSGELVQNLETTSEEETVAFAEQLVAGLREAIAERPVVIALEGPMGAGKTRFAKGAGKALGIAEQITSPSYTLVNEYPGMAHLDLWRLTEFDPAALEMDRYLKPGQLTLIEWPALALPYLEAFESCLVYLVALEPQGESGRRITVRKI